MTVYHFTEQSFPSSDIDWRKQVWEMLRQLTEPAPAAPASEVDLVEKWRIEILGYDNSDVGIGARAAVRLCADELAAWLPAHDVKVRKDALEEAAQICDEEVKSYRGETPGESVSRGALIFASKRIRALAGKPGGAR
jgi:hypothetical protein